jgi:hypothetical protein
VKREGVVCREIGAEIGKHEGKTGYELWEKRFDPRKGRGEATALVTRADVILILALRILGKLFTCC